MKKGFTLVELSIVLVIIGLLISGILVAQSMIATSRVQGLVREIQQYEISINNFKTTYKLYPGDSPSFSPSGAPDGRLWWGDTDGDRIYNAQACNGSITNYETYQVWAHLSQAEMIKGTYPTYSTAACGGGNTDEQFFTGVLTPYMKLNEQIVSMITGYGGDKISFYFDKFHPDQNMFMPIYATPMDTLAIGSKMGIVLYTGTHLQTGLTTGSYSLNNCGDASWNEVSCSDSTAVFSDMIFYFTP